MKYHRSLAAAAAFVCTAAVIAQTPGFSTLYPNTFHPSQVQLGESPFLHSMQKNIEVLKEYDVDRLLAPYLLEAGLDARAPKFENWAGLDGHVGGHYLSALAIHYAATGDPVLKERMQYMLDEMKRAQDANGDGYVGGVPESRQCWNDLRAGDISAISKRWVPWYNMHKVYAGLRDAYTYGGSEQAMQMFLDLCDWGIEAIANLSDEQMERMLDTEFGGMNEVYADAYDLTGDERYLDAAIRFSHHWLLDAMAQGTDNLDNRHANTQVPKVVGYQRVAEMCEKAGRPQQAETFRRAADFFWNTVTGTRSLAIGGNSRREYFPSAADCISYTEEREGPESCNTNNMLKLTEGLFRMNHTGEYADFYERAMFNHILSTQHPGHGGYVYFTSARPAHYRVYSQPNSAMWCCVGTGMENHGKYTEFIYTHDGDDNLQVNLFVPSTLSWGDVTVTQSTDFPVEPGSELTVNCADGKQFTMDIRCPEWCDDFRVKVNGDDIHSYTLDNGYLHLSRKWNDGDRVELSLPMSMRLEEMPNVPDFVAIVDGPIVLGAKVDGPQLDGLVAGDGRWGHIAGGAMVPLNDTPMLIGDRDAIVAALNSLKPASASCCGKDGWKLAFDATPLFDGCKNITLQPFASIHDSRYMMYWLNLTDAQWQAYKDEMAAREAEKLRIDALTVDAVNFGEQQPEADHHMKQERSESGNYQGESYRHALDGWFSCELATDGRSDLSLMARYWGNEQGVRTFDILVDDVVLATCNNAALTGKSEFVDVVYAIPQEMLAGKDRVTVTYKAHPGNYAGGLYHLRLIKSE